MLDYNDKINKFMIKQYQTMLWFAGGLENWFCAFIKFNKVTQYKSMSLSQS